MSRLFSALRSAKTYALQHRVLTGIAVAVILGGAWWGYGKATAATAQTRYVLGTAASSTIVSTVSASGQVAASDSIDIKPQVSGTITRVAVKAGQAVRAGQVIATIDNTSALQAIADAKRTLAADKLSYQQSSAQAPINYQNDQNSLTAAQDSLTTDYSNAYNDISSAYLDLPDVMVQANDTLYGYDFDAHKGQWNFDLLLNLFTSLASSQELATLQSFHDMAKNNYATANSAYAAALGQYQTTSRSSGTDTIDTLLVASVAMATGAAQSLQNDLNFYGQVSTLAQTYGVKLPSSFTTVQSATRTSLTTVNGDISTLLNDKKTLDTAKQAVTAAKQSIALDQVGNPDGANPISLQVSQNSIQKEEEDVANQVANLAHYTIVAPFSGTISAVNAQAGDTAGSAAVASIISGSQIAQLSVNEVDAAKIKLGQKATLTFDAIDSLSLTGTVAEIDSVGTVSQGVVSYNIKITFDTQDSRIKPGMTVNAAIQTAVAQDVLTVPSSAVKTQGATSYVLVFDPQLADTGSTAGVVSSVAPTMVPVTTGISDDTSVEITSGLTPGEQIVVSTRAASATTASTAARATTGAAGAARGGNASFGGGAVLRGL